jgi:hypothetical protein
MPFQLKGCLFMLTLTLSALAQEAVSAPIWPPSEHLLKGLVDGIEPILKSQDTATGRFGTQPWVCIDQNVLLPLAAAWSIKDDKNPWYHSDRVLAAIASGGKALTDDQDKKGMWTFRKKDNSTWGQIYMPWTYSRWIRAYVLVKDALPAADRAAWEKGLRLGFTGIRRIMDGGVHNIPCHQAMALYLAGMAFDQAEWRAAATAFMAKTVAKQNPAGFWSENFGPVIGYNEVYVDAIGVYYSVSKDPVVLEALRRAAQFHAAVLWPDGSAVACLDERQIYHAGLENGTVGFTFTPEGRGYLLQQIGKSMAKGSAVSPDYAAGMLLYGERGTGLKPAAAAAEATAWIGNREGLIRRQQPWQWAMSAYACPVPTNRWIQDRHNLLDVFHDDLGLVAGGGNTKLQPYWSTFTVGDCSQLRHIPGEENPNFSPQIELKWVPEQARIEEAAGAQRLTLKIAGLDCGVACEALPNGDLKLVYEAPADRQVEAHLPLLSRSRHLDTASGARVPLGDENLALSRDQIGAWFDYAGLRVLPPKGTALRWPVRQHDPYKKDGSSPLSAAKLVLVMPFTGVSRYEITLQKPPTEVFPGLAFEARDLKVTVSEGSYTKRLDDLGSQFLGGGSIGQSIRFTLPNPKAGRYEVLGEFVTAYVYGIVQVSVDGQPVGTPFDAYVPEVNSEGERVSFGTLDLTAGDHEIRVDVIGKNAKATNCLISVKRWLLRETGK